MKTGAFEAAVGAVGRTLCSYLLWCWVDAESLEVTFSSRTRQMSFFFWSRGTGGMPPAVFSLIVEFYILEGRKSISFAFSLLTGISQPYPHSPPTDCCFTGTS